MWKLKQLVLLICSLFIGSSVWSLKGHNDQENKQGGYTDKNGKQGKWVYYGKDRPDSGIPAEGKVEEGTYKDDRKEGVWIKYHNDGVTPKLKGEYENNRPKGQYTKYWNNGKVKEIGTFEKGQQHDSLKRFHENGVLAFETVYNDLGKEQGKTVFYYPNGQKEYEYNSENGKVVGTATRYYENGDKKEELVFDANGEPKGEPKTYEPKNPNPALRDPGPPTRPAPRLSGTPRTNGIAFKPNGYNKLYNQDNEIWQDGIFKDGRLWDGKIYVYDRDGILLKVEVFRSGSYHSDGQL